MPESSNARRVHLEGCLNFRDLGGWAARDGRRVRWGQLFRSDALHFMTEEDARRVRDGLGVRAVLDLRSSAEIETDGLGPLPLPPVRHYHVPLFESEEREAAVKEEESLELGDQYFWMLRQAQRSVARVLHIAARTREPAVFHCFAGKDRTGVVAAVLLGVLGVVDEDIVQDYVLSRESLGPMIARLRETPSYAYVFEELPPDTLHAEPGTMQRLLARIRAEYGSIEGYVHSAGLDGDTLKRLAARLLEP